MVETTRRHARLPDARPSGRRFTVDIGLARPVDVFVPGVAAGAADARAGPGLPRPEGPRPDAPRRLLVHFHGAAYVPEQAVATEPGWVLAAVNLGAGSSRYQAAFAEARRLDRLVEAVAVGIAERESRAGEPARPPEPGDSPDAADPPAFSAVHLSGFSAGVGAIRALLGTAEGRSAVDGALLLDGLHASYVPERLVLHQGGRLDTTHLAGVLAFARQAVAGDRALVLTHSTIFPGTFASTTETADWLLDRLGIERVPVLRWGPVGMQQLSEARAGGFNVLGFAGNSAPDHVDHLHALPAFLALLGRR